MSDDLDCWVGCGVGVSDYCNDGADVLCMTSDDVECGDDEGFFDALSIVGVSYASAAGCWWGWGAGGACTGCG